jgi:hypothetical protein
MPRSARTRMEREVEPCPQEDRRRPLDVGGGPVDRDLQEDTVEVDGEPTTLLEAGSPGKTSLPLVSWQTGGRPVDPHQNQWRSTKQLVSQILILV